MTRDFTICDGAWRVQVLNNDPHTLRISNPATKEVIAHIHDFDSVYFRKNGTEEGHRRDVQNVLQHFAKHPEIDARTGHRFASTLAALQRENPDAYRDWIAPLKRDPSTKGEA